MNEKEMTAEYEAVLEFLGEKVQRLIQKGVNADMAKADIMGHLLSFYGKFTLFALGNLWHNRDHNVTFDRFYEKIQDFIQKDLRRALLDEGAMKKHEEIRKQC